MSKWVIYSKDGEPRHWYHAETDGNGDIVQQDTLELHDEWMGECFLTVSISNAEPIDFAVGDYIDYRGERYVIEYDPTVLKKACSGSYGEGFIYDNIKFVHKAQAEIVRCDFTDIVLNDNNLHYTALPTFPFYCETVDDLLDRIQANLNELYGSRFIIISTNADRTRQRGTISGMESAFMDAYNEMIGGGGATGKTGVALSVDNISCWDALTKVHSDFDLNFIQRGYIIAVGTAGVFTSSRFEYGKGRGLYEIERISESDQQIITRLRAYGSENNLPVNYYANLHKRAVAKIDHKEDFDYQIPGSDIHDLILHTKTRWSTVRNAFTNVLQPDGQSLVTLSYNNLTAPALAIEIKYEGDDTQYLCLYLQEHDTYRTFFNAITNGAEVTVSEGVKVDMWPTDLVKPIEGYDYPAALVINRLMLPGFPDTSLYNWVKANQTKSGASDFNDTDGTAVIGGVRYGFSKDAKRPYIDSPHIAEYGIRPGSIYFDGSDETDDIYPTIVGTGVDQIVSAEQIKDSGIYPAGEAPSNFIITLPNLGFNLAELWESGAAIEVTDGMCGGRRFEIASRPTQNDNNTWKCICKRQEDTTLHLWFPYNDFQLNANGRSDKYVLTGIELPKAYVDRASERLFTASIAAIAKNDAPRYTYQPRIDELWMAREHDAALAGHSLHDTLKAGDVFQFSDADLGINAAIIIDVLTIKENGNNGIPTYEVTLRDEKQVSAIQKIQNKVDSLAFGGNGAGGAGGGGSAYTDAQVKSLIESAGKDFFLSRTSDDQAAGVIGFLKGLWIKVKGLFGIDANGDATLRTVHAKSSDEDIDSGIISADRQVKSPTAEINDIVSSNSNSNSSPESIDGTGFWLTNNKGDGSGHSYLEVDELMVRYKMIAMALEVRKESFVGGNQHYTPAGSVLYRVDYLAKDHATLLGYTEYTMPWIGPESMSLKGDVEMETLMEDMALGLRAKIRTELTPEDKANLGFFRCYLIADDGTTQTRNMWRVGDQARCQTFNRAAAGDKKVTSQSDAVQATYNGSDIIQSGKDGNTVYWRLVDQVGTTTLEDGKLYDYIDFVYEGAAGSGASNVAMAGSDWPAAGDHVVCMGNRVDSTRMAMISLETMGGNVPAIKMYQGINTFSLENKRTAIISPGDVTLYSSQFHLITDSGNRIPVKNTRGRWEAGVRYHYYDEVTHNGSTWLCIGITVITGGSVDGYHWLDSSGVRHDYSLGRLNPGQVAREGSTGHIIATNKSAVLYQNYTMVEPSDANDVEGVIWLKTVSKGVEITSESTDFATQPDKVTVGGVEVSGGVAIPTTWYASMELLEQAIESRDQRLGDANNCWLWTRRTVFYSDGRSPVVFHWPMRLGSVADGSVVDFYVTSEVMSTQAVAALPSSSWKPNLGDWTIKGGDYIWVRTTTLYMDGTKTYSFSCTREGKGIASMEEFFLVAASETVNPYPVTASGGVVSFQQKDASHPDAWDETRPQYAPANGKIWLWNFEVTTMNDGSQTFTEPRCIANLSRGIEYIHQWYALSIHDKSEVPNNRRFPEDIKIPANNTAEPWSILPGIKDMSIPTGSEATDLHVWTDEKYGRTPSVELPYQWNLEIIKYNVADNIGSFYDVFYHISSRIGPQGVNGNFKSRVFCRFNPTSSKSAPNTPTGGDFAHPWPGGQNPYTAADGVTWNDGVPSGEAVLWSSVRTFRGDGGTDPGWSTPAPETDTANLDIEFSPQITRPHPSTLRSHPGTAHPSTGIWYDPSDPDFDTYGDMIWRAERKIANGDYVGGWVITRIKGEGAFVLDLDNEADQFGTDSESKVITQQVKETTVSAFDGSRELTLTNLTAQLYYENPNGTDIGIGNLQDASVTADKTTGKVVVTIFANKTISYDTMYALITAECERGEKSVRFTLGKVKSGQKGVDPVIYQLALSDKALAFGRNADNSLTPPSRALTVQVKKTQGNNSEIITVPSGYSVKWGWDDSTTVSGTSASITVSSELALQHKQVWVELWKSGASKWDDRETIPITKDGEGGDNGDTPMQAFQWNTSATVAPTPLPSGATLGSWSATAPSKLTGADYHLWMTQTVKHTAVNGTVTYDNWSPAVRISGDKGDPGADGSDREWIYKRLTVYPFSGTLPKNISRGQAGGTGSWIPKANQYTTEDYVPEGWSDNALPTLDTEKYVYAAYRDKPSGQNQQWGDFSDPIIWSNWGVQGIDGDGVQYVYKLYATQLTDAQCSSFKPTKPSSQNTDGEWLPAGRATADTNTAKSWTDEAENTSESYPYCYCSVIKRISGVWGSYEKLSLWSKWSKDGENAVRIDIDNEADMVQTDSTGKVVAARTVVLKANIYDGSSAATSGITNKTTAANLAIGGCTPSVSLSGGVLTVTWNFTTAHTISSGVQKTITLNYNSKDYSASFSLTPSFGSAIYQLKRSMSSIPFSRDANNALTPASRAVGLSIVKIDGASTAEYTTASAAGVTVRYSTDSMPASASAGTSWASGNITVANTASNLYIAMFNASGVLLDRETIPVVKDGENGAPGAPGGNTATLMLYKRSATPITAIDWSATLTYTFETKSLNTVPSGWSLNKIPAGTAPVYVTAATAYSTSATDTIAASEWAAPVEMVENGGQGEHGVNTAAVFLYQRGATAPAKPTAALTYTFATGALSGTLAGWSQNIPATNGNPCWVIQATAINTTDTDSIAASEWSEQRKLVEDGKSITKTSEVVKYQVGDSGTTAPTGTWYDTKAAAIQQKPWAEDKYMWTRTVITWSDTSTTTLYSAERNPNDGQPGMSIVIGSQSVGYCRRTAAQGPVTDPSTLTYGSTYPTNLVKGDWLYTKTTVNYQNSKGESAGSTNSYSVSYIGTDGQTVEGRGITGVYEHYKASANSTGESAPSTDWGTNPSPSDWNASKPYLWNYERITYSKGTAVERTTPSVVAVWTENGRGIDSIVNFYKKSTLATGEGYPARDPDNQGSAHSGGTATGWSAAVQAPDATYQYLWNYERVTWIEKDGTKTYSYTAPHVIGHFGKNGDTPTVSINASNKHWIINGSDTGVKAEGEDGTGVQINGGVDKYYTTSGKTSLQSLTGMVVGDCYVVNDDTDATHGGHLYFYTGTGSWPNNWRDIGKIKGEPGTSSYLHIAYADEVTLNSSGVPTAIETDGVAGKFLKVYDGERDWWGFCTDNNAADPSSYTAYKWNFMKGRDGDGYEYVYVRSKVRTPAPTIDNTDTAADGSGRYRTDDLFIPKVANRSNIGTGNIDARWTDDPMGVNETYRYEWQAVRKKSEGAWGGFTVSSDPIHLFFRPPFWSRVYKRLPVGTSATTPTGGTYDSPVPTSEGWSDGIPAASTVQGDSLVWTTTRKFADGTTTTWATPQIDRDTQNTDIEYAFEQENDAQPDDPTAANRHGGSGTQIWYDPVLDAGSLPSGKSWSDMVWRAEREIQNGVAVGSWVISRIKGEKGDPGSKVKATESWFLALLTKPSSLTVNTSGSSPTSVVSGTTETWRRGEDTRWSDTRKYLYRLDKYTLADNSVYWSDPYFSSEWADQGPQGKAGLTLNLTPSLFIFTEKRTSSGTSVETGNPAVTISMDRNGDSADSEIASISVTPENVMITTGGSPTGSATTLPSGRRYFNIYSVNTYVDASDHLTHYYEKGKATVVVTLTSGGTCTRVVPIYVNPLGTFRRDIEGDIEAAVGEVQQYLEDDNGNVILSKNLYTQVNSATQSITNLQQEMGDKVSSSTLEQTANRISLSVSEKFAQENEGCYNLLEGTDFPAVADQDPKIPAKNMAAWTERAGYISASVQSNGHNSFYNIEPVSTRTNILTQTLFISTPDEFKERIKKGNTYTLSFKMRVTNINSGLSVRLGKPADVANEGIIRVFRADQVNTWKTCELSFTLPDEENWPTYWNDDYEDYLPMYLGVQFRIEARSHSGAQYVYISEPRLEQGSVRHEYEENYYGLRGSGIDIEKGKITARTDNFEIQNSSGDTTVSVDRDGNLVTAGNAVIKGTIKATNFYHGICLVTENGSYSNEWLYVQTLNDWTTAYGLSVGDYFEATEEVRAKTFDSGQTTFSDAGCVHTVYNADVVVVIPKGSSSGQGGAVVKLPLPQHFPGKIVEIYNRSQVNNIIQCVDYGNPYSSPSYFVGIIYQTADGSSYTENTPQKQVTIAGSGLIRMMATNISGTYRWLTLLEWASE